MKALARFVLFAALAAWSLPCSTRAADPPVAEGLALWIDAAAQPEWRRAASMPALAAGGPVDLVLDGSGKGRHAVQLAAERRPVHRRRGDHAYFQFDGRDDALALEGGEGLASAATLFVLAAPRKNPGGFTALFGTAEAGKNDYTSGLNLDLGPSATDGLSVVNVESAGASGFRDLLQPGLLNAAERPFGDFHVFTVRSRIAEEGNEVFLDGFRGGVRERLESFIGLDRMVIGARLFSNDPNQPPHIQGCFDGAIAEVLLYDRALSDEERIAVERSLLEKLVPLNGLLHGTGGHALETVEEAPVVQMLVPGFSVHELPLEIGNVNNLRYRHDGKLVALGYDGRIHLLSDTDGDGLEDQAELFWGGKTLSGPLGIVLLPEGDPRGEGLFVASKGKISLFLDRDRDGRAEDEQIVATGWKQSFHGVDTLGLARDPRDGSLYFGIGTQNFADAYVIEKSTGRSLFDIAGSFGTIQRLSADFSKRETVCTGVRFTCALAFNAAGDLFATDQEGATWLPNGNPLDELLHIEAGKHYGFPPRHPRHLPGVRDEPPVAQYGPQHQSAVGLVFNEGVNGGPHFGPAHWRGDALVCGESRGKIWRTKLAKTPLGYVAQNHLLACLNLLTVDACVTPAGGLAVACHGGPPDWGTGPTGEGRLFQLRYARRELPQPVQTWAARPDEFRVAFDRPLDPADWAAAREETKVEAGEHVGAGDRFETVRPGYQVVRDQLAEPRRWVEVLGLSLSEDRRVLALRVPRQTEPVNYAITLPLPEAWRTDEGLTQHPTLDLLATLGGIAVRVEGSGGEVREGVLPHLAPAAATAFTAGSSEHETLLRAAAEPGARVEARAWCDTGNPFLPAVQKGSTLDWDPATDPVASRRFVPGLDGEGEIRISAGPGDEDAGAEAEAGTSARRFVEIRTARSGEGSGIFLKGEAGTRVRLDPDRLQLPWAAGRSDTGATPRVRDDVTGNWLRGRELFFGEAGCSACHSIRGEGIAFGPDLSNLVHRDRDSVLHDILQPSATINPDHVGSQVRLHNGLRFHGLTRPSDRGELLLALAGGGEIAFPRSEVAAVEPLAASLMPADSGRRLRPEQREDLLAYLLLPPLEPAPITRTDPPLPPARTREALREVLGAAQRTGDPTAERSPLRLLLVGGPKDHGADEHDYPLWLARWSRLLRLAEGVTVTSAMEFPSADQLAAADAAVFYNANPGWDEERAARLDAFHERGGGCLYLHYGVDGGRFPDAAAERVGLAFTLGSKFRHGEFDLVFPQPAHPITRGFPTLHFTDETYWSMRGDPQRLSILATAVEDGAPRPELWTLQRKQSRIVVCIPGHYTWTFDDPLFRVLVLRGICWAARQPDVDRLSELAAIGARIEP